MTVLTEVKNRMAEMLKDRADQLETIRAEQAQIQKQIDAAALDMKRAAETLDVTSYGEAAHARSQAQTAYNMYSDSYEQIRKQEYITEAESDKVINSLLEYEEKTAAAFKKDAQKVIDKLADLLQAYQAETRDTESTIAAWTQHIHANYSTRGGTSFFDPISGTRTDRSPEPVPIRRVPYMGCEESQQIDRFLKMYSEGTK